MRGNDDARRTAIADFDADARVVLDWLKHEGTVASNQLGAMGFCIGGHLAFRAALQSDMKATASCYPTGVQNGKLGRGTADTIQRFSDIQGELLVIFGTLDPHVPEAGRETVIQALKSAGTVHNVLIYEADHTFMRNDGYRYDPEVTDTAWAEIIAFFKRVFT